MVLRTVLAGVLVVCAGVGSASAQSREPSSLRDVLVGARPGADRSAATPRVARYSAGDETFVLDRSGEAPLLKFEGEREVWALRPAPGPRGDVIYKDDLGRPVIRATRLGGVTVFTSDRPSGLPAAPVGPAAGLKPAAMSAVQLWRHLVRQSARASRALGRRIDFQAEEVVQGSEAVYADAASLTAEAIARSAPGVGPQDPLSRIRKVEFIDGSRPSAVVDGASLEITVAPGHGLAGRPSSQRVLTALGAD